MLPLLLGEALVAHFDLKANRRESVLEVRGAYVEPGAGPVEVADAATGELSAMASWLQLDTIDVVGAGDFGSQLAKALQRPEL